MKTTLQNTSLNKLINLSRLSKRFIVMITDVIGVFVILCATIFLVKSGDVSFIKNLQEILLINISTIIVLYASGFYHNILRSFDDKVMKPVLIALSALLCAYLFFAYGTSLFILPKSVYFIYILFLFNYLWFSRGLARKLLIHSIDSDSVNRTLIYGAGSAGTELLATLQVRQDYDIVGFLDDDEKLFGGKIAGVKILDTKHIASIVNKFNVKSILLAMPSVAHDRKKQIIHKLEPLPVKVLSLPSMHQMVNGEVATTELQEVDVIDLLGRAPTPPNTKLLNKNISNKSVLITGAGGSIGSELCRQIAQLQPKKLVLFEVSEFALYSIEREITSLVDCSSIHVIPVIGSVLNSRLLKNTMNQHQVNTVYHAAAYKHVPLVEANPFSGVINNTVGTATCAKVALDCSVETFVLISTDKAVRPTNVMGASKRLSELVCQGLAKEKSSTQFSMVRFGNVLGSSGSVVPLFKKQIAQGGPITVTHPEITRYFMTIPEAALLVIQSGAMGTGGDVFLLDMGEPVKIVDLAKKMIRLTGLTEKDKTGNGDIDIQYSGLRPGEKLYEELLIEGDNVTGTDHNRIMRSVEKSYSMAEINELLDTIEIASNNNDISQLIAILEKYVEGYVCSDGLNMNVIRN